MSIHDVIREYIEFVACLMQKYYDGVKTIFHCIFPPEVEFAIHAFTYFLIAIAFTALVYLVMRQYYDDHDLAFSDATFAGILWLPILAMIALEFAIAILILAVGWPALLFYYICFTKKQEP